MAVPPAAARRIPLAGRTRPARPKAPRGRVAVRRPRSVVARRVPSAWRVAAVPGVAIRAPVGPRVAMVLSADALAFVAGLHRRFDALRREPMPEDESPAPIEANFPDRQVVVAADHAPRVDFRSPDAGWTQRIERHLQVKDADESAIVVMRPRDLHAAEQHLTVDGQPVSAALFDFGLCAFHRAARGAALYCDLSHVRDPREARLWDDVLAFAEEQLGLPVGSIKTAMIAKSDA
jgi:malate synthase